MMKPELLQELAAEHGGIVPDVVDLSDDDKNRVLLDVMCEDDTEIIEYFSENSVLSMMMIHSSDEAIRHMQNSAWDAIEDSVRHQIYDYNAMACPDDDETAIKMAALDGADV